MKKRLLALLSASLLVMSMSVTVFAANSPSSSNTTVNVEVTGDVNETTGAGQSITDSSLQSFASTTSISSDAGATIGTKIDAAQVKAIVKTANEKVQNAKIATIVDIVVPAGTKSAKITLSGLSDIKAGDAVTVFHYKSDGTVEAITPSKVADGSVEFTMTSFSPVAVVKSTANSAAAPAAGGATVTNTAVTTESSPKTADNAMLILALAAVAMGGSVLFLKRSKEV